MPPRRGAGGNDYYIHVNALLLASLCVAAARAGAVSRVTRPRDRHAVISRSWPQQSDCPGGGELCRSGVGTVWDSGMDELQKLCRTKTNKKWCAAHTPATVSTQDHRLGAGVMMLDTVSTSPVELLAWCCVAARICTITTTAQPRPGRGLRKFGFEQRSGIARPGATSPRAAPCQG